MHELALPSAQPTHYHTLNLAPSATPEAIRKAYRSIAKQLHPDVNPDSGAQSRFAAVAIAYEVLSDPEKRREYDRQLQAQDTSPASLRAHYSWSNVAAPAASATPEHPDPGELDDIYDTFFAPKSHPKPPSHPKGPAHHTPRKPRRG